MAYSYLMIYLSDPSSSHSPSSDMPPLSKDDHPGLFEPLYPGASISLCGAMCAIMHFCSTHKLSYAAIGDLLRLLILLFPVPTKLPPTFYLFQKFFNRFRSKRNVTRVCSQCLAPLSDCSCSHSRSTPSHLIQISILNPLKTILFHESYTHAYAQFLCIVYSV